MTALNLYRKLESFGIGSETIFNKQVNQTTIPCNILSSLNMV